MQAKPPLACHANLVAESPRGGVAARKGSGRGGLTELGLGVGWGGVGEADKSIMCIEVQQ